jgi:hypothetical protein
MKSSVQHTRTYHQSQHKPVAIIPTHFGTILGSRVRVKVMIRVSLGYGQARRYSSDGSPAQGHTSAAAKLLQMLEHIHRSILC